MLTRNYEIGKAIMNIGSRHTTIGTRLLYAIVKIWTQLQLQNFRRNSNVSIY